MFVLLFLQGEQMRTLLAILAAAAGGMAGAYIFGNYVAGNLPDAVMKDKTYSSIANAMAVATPAVIAYGLVAGLHHNKAGLPAKS